MNTNKNTNERLSLLNITDEEIRTMLDWVMIPTGATELNKLLQKAIEIKTQEPESRSSYWFDCYILTLFGTQLPKLIKEIETQRKTK